MIEVDHRAVLAAAVETIVRLKGERKMLPHGDPRRLTINVELRAARAQASRARRQGHL